MNFFINFLKGLSIGAGAILPGVSSGVLCVIFGIYEKLLSSILNFFDDIKHNSKFLFPIVTGAFCGVVLFGNILNYLFNSFPLQIKCFFIGIILASIPSLVREIHKREVFKISCIFFFIISLCFGVFLVYLEKTATIQEITSSPSFFICDGFTTFFANSTNVDITTFLYLLFCGFVMSIGVVVPGVSSTIILMLLGVYPVYLASVSYLYLPVLIPMAIGLLIGGFLFMTLTQFLLDHFYAQTFYSIIGFTFGSIFVLLPKVAFNWINVVIGVLCVALGFCTFFKKL